MLALLLVFAAQAFAGPATPPPVQGAATLDRPKTAPLPGELRKRADRQFLAHRGIGFGPAAAARPGIRRSPAESLSLARAQHMSLVHAASLRAEVSSSPGTWQSLGPAQVTTAAYGAVTGRITSLAADPQDSTGNTLYLGSTGGGVWKSTNAAASSASSVTFVPLTDDLPAFNNTLGSLSIGALTVQPTSANVILAGTGDINDALDSYYGVGILRSADGGNTWTLIGGTKDGFVGGLENYSFVGNGFAGFAWSGVNPNLVVAAVAQSAEGLLVNAGPAPYMRAGLFYSTDAGQTWYMAVIEDSPTSVVQSPNVLGYPPGNSATSVVWNAVRQRFYAAVRYHGYYESLDGVTWTRLANQPGAALAASACPTNPGGTGQTSCPIFRGALAVQPVTGDMFALTTGPCNSADPSCSGPVNIDLDQGLYRDVCSTTGLAVTSCASNTVAFGTQIASAALENGNGDTTIPLADYDLTLAAVPSGQDTILFAGTEDIYRCSLANSCAWRNTTNIQTCASAMVAPSQHATESTFGSTGLIYFANDGGLWRSIDMVGETGPVCASTDASHYQNLNSGIGSLAEIEHFSVSPASPTTLLAGVGGFGTASTTTGTGAWPQILTGEGSYTAIDPADVQNWYTEAGAGVDILRCTQGASCNAAGFGTTPVISSSQVEDDADYFDDPAPWILDPLNTANLLLGTCRVWRGPAAGGWGSSDLLSPMLDGNQEPFCNGNAEIRSIGAGLDSNAASGTEEMYAGLAGPYDGGGLVPGHFFASTVPLNGGLTTWTDRYSSTVTNSSNTPQFNEGGFAISSIAVDPHDPTGQTVYVTIQGFSGNDINGGQVYGSTNGGQTWVNLTNSLPLSPANSVIVDPNVPSILYVALDTGVYYTENVANCANQALTCWAVYGSGLPNAPVTSLQIYSSGGSSTLEAATYGRGIWALGLLTSPALGTLTPATYSFGGEPEGSTTTATSFTLNNTGATAIVITDIEAVGDYAETNDCGSSLAAAASCTIQVTFTPTASGDRPGYLYVYSNVSGGRLSSTLDGTGLASGTVNPVHLAFAPSSLAFGSVVQGQTSSQQSVTLTNSGSLTAQLQTPTITGDFAIASNPCGTTLAAASSCAMQITFSPSATGNRAGSLSASASNGSGTASVALSGTGTAVPSLVLTPTTLTFIATAVGATSAVQNVTVANTGSANVNLLPFTLTGDFVLSADTCSGVPLKPNYSCTLSINFAPTAGGARTGVLTVASSTESHTVALNGTGLTPATDTLAPNSLTFGSQVFGTVSATQSVTLTNSGGSTLGSIATTVAGPFVATNNCGTLLGGGLTCSIAVSYAPSAAGAQTGQLTVSDAIRSQTVALTGTGVLATSSGAAAVATPVTYAFGGYAVGGTTPAQTVTVTNTGTTTLQGFTASTATTSFAVDANNCGGTLTPGASCTVGATFAPQQPGNAVDQLTLSSSSLGSPLSVALSGSGESFQIAIVGASSAIVTNGQTAIFKLSVTPVGISAGTVAVTCSGVPASAVCTVNPPSLSLAGGAAGSITTTIATGGVTTSASLPPPGRGLLWKSAAGLALLLPCLFAGSRGRRRFMLLALSVAVVLAPAACGVHASDGTTGTTGGGGSGTTPPGTYAVTVTATYPGAQLTATFNLTVE